MMSEWQSIETAPIEPFDKEKWFMRHSPNLLLWTGHFCQVGSYRYTSRGKGKWEAGNRIVTPTHWMPLPKAPE